MENNTKKGRGIKGVIIQWERNIKNILGWKKKKEKNFFEEKKEKT